MAPKARRFAPRLQVLDDRSLPSVTCVLSGTILTVTGDAGANTITITDSGTDTGIEVIGDGERYVATGPITNVLVDAAGGDDTVDYNLTASLTASRWVHVELGRGADTFTANLAGQALDPWVSLALSAYGGGGGDAMVLNAQGVNTGFKAILNVYFSGDAGKDRITWDYYPSGLADGSVTLNKDQRR